LARIFGIEGTERDGRQQARAKFYKIVFHDSEAMSYAHSRGDWTSGVSMYWCKALESLSRFQAMQ
jgi:hypothetical protein